MVDERDVVDGLAVVVLGGVLTGSLDEGEYDCAWTPLLLWHAASKTAEHAAIITLSSRRDIYRPPSPVRRRST